MQLWQWLGELHPKLVQFPLVLCLMGLLFDLAGALNKSPRAHWAAFILSLTGTVALLFAFICGIYAEIGAGRAGIPQHPIELHELMANIAAWGFVLLLVWRILLLQTHDLRVVGSPDAPARAINPSPPGMPLYLTVGLLWYALLLLTAYLGGKLVFEYGAGVAATTPFPSLDDLNALATRQTDENLRYSEWMHHIFGWLTLGLAVSLIIPVLHPKSEGKFRWIVPLFLLAGGIFLFFMADRDLYALSDPRQWRDREVQLHKSIATIMAIIGVVGITKLRRPATSSTNSSSANASPDPSTRNSKLVAIMALIGGALLFTHVHSVAPYANVAAGVYIFHIALGIVALLIGTTRLLQEHPPASLSLLRFATWKRSFAALFAFFMLIEASLLISYNEGLPWFIGYGTYNRWGPNHNPAFTVAPFGNFRALLYINQQSGALFIAFRDRYSDAPISLALDAAPQLLLGQGPHDLALPLVKSIPEGATPESAGPAWTSSTFEAHADLFKTAAFFNPRLILQQNGRQLIGTFDPWVTPAITPIPPNELARFICPMHDAVKSPNAGVCPLCGMDLIPITPPRPSGQLADPTVELHTTLDHQQNLSATFNLAPFILTNGHPEPATLALVHEQPIHLILVSEDLSYFDHLHPHTLMASAPAGPPLPNAPTETPAYQFSYTFPRPGSYILFADFTPKSLPAQAFRIPIRVDSTGIHLTDPHSPLPASQLLPTMPANVTQILSPIPFPATPYDQAPLDPPAISHNKKPLPAIQIQLTTQPRTLYAGLHTQLIFHLADATGKPVTTIAPYLAAFGHATAISADTSTYLHFHPEQLRTPSPDDRAGPDLAFHARFPSPGTYRLFAQFRLDTPAGPQLLIAPFTLDIHQSPIPPSLINLLLNETE